MNEFQKRLERIMQIQGIRAVDVVRKSAYISKAENLETTITKQNMSNYLSGRTIPPTNKLQILSKALNVEPSYFTKIGLPISTEEYSSNEINLIQYWRIASDKDKDMIAFILSDYGFVYEPTQKSD